ncbi:MAG: hypothetical protein H7Z10_00355 [Gemmatimonadaceae bacterium]|nr:hypothetical protein [Acetobacteraceae bacterium]
MSENKEGDRPTPVHPADTGPDLNAAERSGGRKLAAARGILIAITLGLAAWVTLAFLVSRVFN